MDYLFAVGVWGFGVGVCGFRVGKSFGDELSRIPDLCTENKQQGWLQNVFIHLGWNSLQVMKRFQHMGKLIIITLKRKRPWKLSGTTKSCLFFALLVDV